MKSVDTNTAHNAATPSATRRRRWVVVVMASLLILLLALLALLAFVSGIGAWGFMPPPMAAAYPQGCGGRPGWHAGADCAAHSAPGGI
jgi:hypothetical protein